MKKIKLDSNKYHINKSTNDGCITYVLKPKKRNCFVCKKSFESTGNEILFWKDDDSNKRNGWFCKEHYSLWKKYFSERKRLV